MCRRQSGCDSCGGVGETPRGSLVATTRGCRGGCIPSHISRRSSRNNSVRHALGPHAALDAVVVADGGSRVGAWQMVASSAKEFWSGGTWQRWLSSGVRRISECACGETSRLSSGMRASVMEGDNDNEYLTSVSLLLPVFVLAPREHHPSLDQRARRRGRTSADTAGESPRSRPHPR